MQEEEGESQTVLIWLHNDPLTVSQNRYCQYQCAGRHRPNTGQYSSRPLFWRRFFFFKIQDDNDVEGLQEKKHANNVMSKWEVTCSSCQRVLVDHSRENSCFFCCFFVPPIFFLTIVHFLCFSHVCCTEKVIKSSSFQAVVQVNFCYRVSREVRDT